ncbi:hypothetical protein C8R44DRAFT_816883 [Mycena epipterygia]|nr:hypothetical protein C8R44DRAFT_816883 [Mycena epipterygia]
MLVGRESTVIMVARRGTISDNYPLNTCTLTFKYGLCGLVYLKIPGRDLPFGLFGRTLRESMTYLMSLMGRRSTTPLFQAGQHRT